jgi:hypothetical protein
MTDQCSRGLRPPPTTGETEMNITNDGMSIIAANGANIIKRYDDAELVAVLHLTGAVGIYAEDGDMLCQVSPLHRSAVLGSIALADKIMGATA